MLEKRIAVNFCGTAENMANFINMTPEELEIVENRGIALQDERGRIAYAE